MKTTTRPFYKTKAEWAAAQASDMRARARRLRFQSSAGSSIRARRKFQQVDGLNAEAARFEVLAARFLEQGV